MTRVRARHPVRGFTLIEVLIVIGLLSLLMFAILPMFTNAEQRSMEALCQTLVRQAESAANAYNNQRDFRDYPPDDSRDINGKLKLPADNGINSGIESFLLFVNRLESRQPVFPEGEKSFCNTDGDKVGTFVGKLEKQEKVEIADPWGNPLAYFHNRNYDKPQVYRLGEVGEKGEQDQTVSPHRSPDGGWLSRSKFQVFSAGPNGKYGDEDDIGNW